MTADRLILSFRIGRFQRVAQFLFLILKNTAPNASDGARQNAGDGGGNFRLAGKSRAVWISCSRDREIAPLEKTNAFRI